MNLGKWEIIRITLYVALLLISFLIERKTRLIPNALTYGFVLLGLGLSVAEGLGAPFPWTPIADSAIGLALCFGSGAVIFAQRLAPGGLVKLLAAAGAVARSPLAAYLAVSCLFLTLLLESLYRKRTSATPIPGSVVVAIASILMITEYFVRMMLKK